MVSLIFQVANHLLYSVRMFTGLQWSTNACQHIVLLPGYSNPSLSAVSMKLPVPIFACGTRKPWQGFVE